MEVISRFSSVATKYISNVTAMENMRLNYIINFIASTLTLMEESKYRISILCLIFQA